MNFRNFCKLGLFLKIFLPMRNFFLPISINKFHSLTAPNLRFCTALDAAHPFDLMINRKRALQQNKESTIHCNGNEHNITTISFGIFPGNDINIDKNKCQYCIGEEPWPNKENLILLILFLRISPTTFSSPRDIINIAKSMYNHSLRIRPRVCQIAKWIHHQFPHKKWMCWEMH